MSTAVDTARQLIDAAQRVVVLTGAGISTDSGIPDFRGPQGVWTKNPEAEKASNIRNYVADSAVRAARWQQLLTSPYRDREPNVGHHALVHLEQRGKLDLLITQNVDGLHHKAGSNPDLVVEIHGNMRQVKCLACDERAPIERALARVEAGEADPPCRSCGGMLKSATVSFGESLVTDDLERADLAARSCDLMLTVGTTLAVYPIAHVVPIAHAAGAKVIILNAEPTELDHLATVVVRGTIADTLPNMVGLT